MKKPKLFTYPEGKWWIMLERFIEWLRVHNYSETTLAIRDEHIRYFIKWCEERNLLEINEITFPLLERYQIYISNYKKTSKAYSSSKYLGLETQLQRLTSVRMFFRYLLRSKEIAVDPSAELILPRVSKKLPKAIFNSKEVETLLAMADLSTPQSIRDRAMMEVLYSTGIRRAELGNLKLDDLDKERGILFIRCGKGQKDRVVPIGERAIAYLELYLEKVRQSLASLSKGKEDNFIFLNKEGSPFALAGIADRIRQYVRRAGKETGSCHLLRHTCATVMLENGADIRYIQEMLGHNSLATTQLYTKVTQNKLKEVHTSTHPSAKLLNPIVKEQAIEEETNQE